MASAYRVPTHFTARDRLSQKVQRMQRSVGTFSAKAQAAFAKVQRRARAFRGAVSRVNNSIFNMKNAAGALAVAGAARGIKRLAENTANAGDEITKTARRTGMSVEQLEAYHYAAERAGVRTGMFDKAMESLGKRVGELQNDTGSLLRKLEKQGRTALIEQLKNVENNDEAFRLLSEAMKNTETSVQRQALATAAFSKTNQKVLQMMRGGEKQLQSYKERFEQIGIGFSDLNVDTERFADKQKDAQVVMQSIKNVIGANLMPVISKFNTKLVEWFKNNKALVKQKVKEWIQKIKDVINKAVTVGKSFVSTMMDLKGVIWASLYPFRLLWFWISSIVGVFTDSKKGAEENASKMQMLGTVLGFVTTALILMNIAGRAAVLVQGIMRASSIALTGVQYAKTGAIWAATAAQWAWNAALYANPIGLIIAALAGLIALIWYFWDSIVSVIGGFIEWVVSAAKAVWNWAMQFDFIRKPLEWLYGLFVTLKWVWNKLVEAITDTAIWKAIKKIGSFINKYIIRPVKKLFGWLGKITGLTGGDDGGGEDRKQAKEQMMPAMPGQGEDDDRQGPGRMDLSRDRQGAMQAQQQQQLQQQLDINIKDPQGRAEVKEGKGNMKPRIKTSDTGASFDAFGLKKQEDE